ncbi:hypothetical protein TSUD_28670 [Trifolium subterraneum]|uniref:Uncharacterized protein n=1 Tax=Trifolium subterraneum TaxID=3900 RepID=A0A2Z6P6V6_TRISU|nr:hypothetical protein TSUD_28670 [Trifolium subterraneum]
MPKKSSRATTVKSKPSQRSKEDDGCASSPAAFDVSLPMVVMTCRNSVASSTVVRSSPCRCAVVHPPSLVLHRSSVPSFIHGRSFFAVVPSIPKKFYRRVNPATVVLTFCFNGIWFESMWELVAELDDL